AIFLRYPLVDPISLALFSPGCAAISEHHTKELEETRLMRDWRYPFEKYGARNFLNRFSGISAVTDELLQYELKRGNLIKPTFLAPNCIDVGRYRGSIQSRLVWGERKVKMAMICTEFVPWHGLDKVLQNLRGVRPDEYELHLCGGLTAEQSQDIKGFPSV